MHLTARTGNVERFLFIFKKSIESDARLLEYNDDHENPFHIAARRRILPDVVKEYLSTWSLNKLTQIVIQKNWKTSSYVRNALGNRCALNNSKRTPLDMVSREVKKEVREIAGIKESLMCNKKFRLYLYIVGAIACVTALCLSLYFLYLCSQSLTLTSMAAITYGGFGYLSCLACGETYDLNDVNTLMDGISTKAAAKITAHA
ncbi:hypothetical protein IHO40_03105 [Wolbachia endosymbiont of Mansonella ozzardi]|uniref:hypothetical protein n=1 Tax=Wolbachia endosymbiont of Mansonella ozzardi TaxID=137464 RepID=UPI001CE06B17|nr:hypothetical protein [Wolbachia endosymbiont of Mansonella ozzardi]MCA4775090.1 hypothetical protein [Wolbachia endosymbiont of Mansonella ozzardi]